MRYNPANLYRNAADYVSDHARSMKRVALVGLTAIVIATLAGCASSSGQQFKTPGLRKEAYLPSTRDKPDYPGGSGTAVLGLSDFR